MRKLTVLLTVLSISAQAEIITDGTLGQNINLPGPNFQIDASLGQQHGDNLFHSFQDFNLNSLESATFSGPDSVQNILSRVTGDNSSNIDGLIRSTIPNADMYFLNPNGIMFGPNAQLDVQGSFHASTADYLRLGENGRFDVRSPNDSVLTVAPPMAFGFLNAPSDIEIRGSHLSVVPKSNLSMTGGNLTLQDAELSAPSGQINIVSVASKGEITPKQNDLSMQISDMSSFTKLGHIEMINSQIETSGSPSGGTTIRGGQLKMNNSSIYANNLGDTDGKYIDIEISDSIQIQGDLFGVISHAFGKGDAGHVVISTPYLEIDQGTIDTSTKGEGNGGNIDIKAVKVDITEGGIVASDSYSAGNGGDINITATKSLSVVDKRIFLTLEQADFISTIGSASLDKGDGGRTIINTGKLILDGSGIASNSHISGNSGEILINANSFDMINGGSISATVMSQSTGQGGSVILNIKEKIYITGFRPGLTFTTTDVFENLQSAIVLITFGTGNAGNVNLFAKELVVENNASIATATTGLGDAGNLTIDVDNLYLTNGGVITNSSGGMIGGKIFPGFGPAGTLKITAKNEIVVSGQSAFTASGLLTNTLVSAPGGNIEIETDKLTLADGGTISANSLGTGDAGTLDIKANTISLTDGGNITTSSANAAGGNIALTSSNLLFLRDGQITTSVGTGVGKGGDITIDNPIFIVMDGGKIKAQADAGRGGNISIKSDQFITSPDSLISASSKLGIDGQVRIDSPDMDMAGFLVILPGGFVEANMKSCNTKDMKSSFKVNPRHRIVPFSDSNIN
ncbi:filamentous hemagglutinin N-terminal domain-containing protein [Candidatus Halobeggiatoa sp. HSG11]|nr:filamentous hemagglutinin N-terminal domain-containing protein [Candidatus Halobeggiatoa sp. HSG11]